MRQESFEAANAEGIINSRIYIGDSRDVLKELHDKIKGQVALVVTSPPYNVDRGYESYLKSATEYWNMVWEVLELTAPLVSPFSMVAINFADKYANAKEYGRPLEISYIPNYIWKMKQLDFDLWARIIWNKNRLPDGARHITSKSRFEGQMRICPDWEYIFIWRKRGEGKPPKKQITMTKEQWKLWSKGVWSIDPVRRNPLVDNTKLAIFPDELPRRLIEMYTARGDIVLDPFCGTGTTVKVARRLGRIGIGIEKNPTMLEVLKLNLQPELFINNKIEFS